METIKVEEMLEEFWKLNASSEIQNKVLYRNFADIAIPRQHVSKIAIASSERFLLLLVKRSNSRFWNTISNRSNQSASWTPTIR